MPPIRAIGRWIGRRNEVTEPYVPAQPMSGGDQGMAWTLVVLVASPILAFLVLTGLAYDGVTRVDRRRLGPVLDWGIAVVVAAVLVGVLIVAALNVLQSR